MKMKLAVVLGVAQMLVGLLLRFTNAMYEKNMVAWFYFCRWKRAASLDVFLEVSWCFISIFSWHTSETHFYLGSCSVVPR